MPMLIDRVEHTDAGIRIYDVDGSHIEMIAEDAFQLSRWIRTPEHYQALYEAMRRADKRERQRRKDFVE
jgi:hypothetical protein